MDKLLALHEILHIKNREVFFFLSKEETKSSSILSGYGGEYVNVYPKKDVGEFVFSPNIQNEETESKIWMYE